jgi:hypothetical protein
MMLSSNDNSTHILQHSYDLGSLLGYFRKMSNLTKSIGRFKGEHFLDR